MIGRWMDAWGWRGWVARSLRRRVWLTFTAVGVLPVAVWGVVSLLTVAHVVTDAAVDHRALVGMALLAWVGTLLGVAALLGWVAHRPLAPVAALAQLLSAPQVADVQRLAWVQALLTSGQTLMQLLGDVLMLVQAEANQLDLAREPLAPAELFDEVRNAYTERAQAQGLTLQVVWQADPAQRYLGDAPRLRQMLDHLIVNALKFSTSAGSIAVQAQEVQREGAVATLRFAVQDSGPGGRADQISRLFQPFARLDGLPTHHASGAGLGLALVKRLALAMGGGVRVESGPGGGACFSFSVVLQALPLRPSVAPQAALGTGVAPAGPAPLAVAPSAALRAQWQAGLRGIAPLLQAHRYDALVQLQALQTLTDQTPLAADCAALGAVLQSLDFDQAAAWVQAQLATVLRDDG